jgi:hypothetical protein
MARGFISKWSAVVAATALVAAANAPAAPATVTVDVAASQPATPLAQDFADRIGQLEAEVAQLQARSSSATSSVALAPRLWDLYASGWYGGAEATILEPFMSGALAQNAFAPFRGELIEQQFLAGVRYQVGWANEAGLGIRGRYWSYLNSFAFTEPFANDRLGIALQAADLEATMTQQLRKWDTLLAAGVRYGKLGYSSNVATFFGAGTATFEGVGPTVAVEGRRRLGESAFSLYGNVRGSALFGTIANRALFTNLPAATIQGEVMGVAENQLGLAWDRVTASGLVIEARACWEMQYWMNPTFSDDSLGIGTNLGLIGPTLCLQVAY